MAKRFDYVATQCLGCRYAIYQGACTHPDVDQDDFISAANDACRLFTAGYPRPRTVSGTECGIVPVSTYERLQTDLAAAATARAEAAEAALAIVFAEMEAEEKRLAEEARDLEERAQECRKSYKRDDIVFAQGLDEFASNYRYGIRTLGYLRFVIEKRLAALKKENP